MTSFILKNLKKKNINVLELGSGEGFQLSNFSKNKRFNTIGLDYYDFPIKSKNKKVLPIFNKKKGKEAHKARLDLDNFILSQNFNDAFTFFKGCHNVSLGRNSLIILKKND